VTSTLETVLLGLSSGLVGAIIGGVATYASVGHEHQLQSDTDRRTALSALAVEWDALAAMDVDGLKRRGPGGGQHLDVAFTPIPTNAYQLAFPYFADIDGATRKELIDLGFRVSAYNASAAFFNTTYGLPGAAQFVSRIERMAGFTISQAVVAMVLWRRVEPSLNQWVR
jgi:hypothetical protein